MNIQDIINGWLFQQDSIFPENTSKSQAVIQYEKCKKNPSSGMSGFHSPSNSVPNPFSFCGYADTDIKWCGVAFRINRDCFDGRDALLYCRGEIHPKLRNKIEKYSGGLTQISVFSQDEIRFRLDHTKIKENISVDGGKLISATKTGGYVLVIPRTGEFNIELGQIIDGERIPLHYDSFCMK